MRSRASINGHPIHPMLVTFPVGLWGFSFIADLIFLSGGENSAIWSVVAYYTMIGGIVGALIAAVFGLIDLIAVTVGQTRRIALTHMAFNLVIVGLYIVNAWLRAGDRPGNGPIWLSLLCIVLLGISGWLGGELVFRHGVGVERTSH